ncbi:hypothetical protein [Levilactobacillus tujiorum]|uniref:Uncharacterized protein n=1 Tax=Levilactobacillus tujiorum TaxID=2912243 RepID=A0ABX1L257_9LACO|nr:hypothetical protein [Levilactobacillus tujiorum]MCH5464206.1 hypothetical protein [Levilactobacillus tujiorum]NLR11608.1 hypothetical protein [Lactobacillus sp. HBUAS51387]NLR29110.1 hypothetical protein [Levilactobacillus tujiorum]NLR30860.1 hypothetical protein [Levilactobacillus tujiorum]
MFTQFSTLLGGLHGVHSFRVFHWIFRENPMIGTILIVGLVLFLIYRYMNRR